MNIPPILQHSLLVTQVRAIIEYAANSKTTVNYKPLAQAVKAFSGGKLLAQALGTIMEEDHLAGRPLTCALVVSSVTDRPGKGFFDKARSLGYQMPYGEERFWASQCKALGVTP